MLRWRFSYSNFNRSIGIPRSDRDHSLSTAPEPLQVVHLILPVAPHWLQVGLRFVPLQAVQAVLTCTLPPHLPQLIRRVPPQFGQVPYLSPKNPFLTITCPLPSHRGQVIFPSWQDEHLTVIWPVASQRVQRQIVQSKLRWPLQLGHES